MKTIILTAACAVASLLATARDRTGTQPEGLRVPVTFIENKGQVADEQGRKHPEVLYTTQVGSTGLFFSAAKVSYVFNDMDLSKPKGKGDITAHKIDLLFRNANPGCAVSAGEEQEGTYNFFEPALKGNVTKARSFKKIVYTNLYPNIDLVFSIQNEQVKYDFILHPGADLGAIQLEYSGSNGLQLNSDNSLVVRSYLGDLRDRIPYSYTELKGEKKPVKVSYKQNGTTVSFAAPDYPADATLVIDPQLTFYSTFGTGGPADWHVGKSVYASLDKYHDILYAGYTTASAFLSGVTAYGSSTLKKGFLAKFNSSGTLVWATTLANASGNTELNDVTFSAQYPFACGTTDGSGLYNAFDAYQGGTDGFVTSFDVSGVPQVTRHIGSGGDDGATSIATAYSHQLAVGGYCGAQLNRPVNIVGTGYHGGRDGFVIAITSGGSMGPGFIYPALAHVGSPDDDEVTDVVFSWSSGPQLVYAGTTRGDASLFSPVFGSVFSSNASSGDNDVFLSKLDYYGAWNSALCGGFFGDDGAEEYLPRVDASQVSSTNTNVYLSFVTGSYGLSAFTSAASFQQYISPASYDNFFTIVDAGMSSLLYASYLHSTAPDLATGEQAVCGIKVDQFDNVYVFGTTNGDYLSYTHNLSSASSVVSSGGLTNFKELFLSRFNPNYSYAYTALIGDDNNEYCSEMSLDYCNKNIYMTGHSYVPSASDVYAINGKVDVDLNPGVITLVSSNGNNLPSYLSVLNNLGTLSGASVQWYFNGTPIQNKDALGNDLDSLLANMPGEYSAVISYDDHAGCGEYHSNILTFEENCSEEIYSMENLNDRFLATGGAAAFDSERFYLDDVLHIYNGETLTLKNCYVVATSCARIIVQSGGELVLESSALTGCPNWQGIMQDPGVNPPVAVTINRTGITRALAGVFSYNTSIGTNQLIVDITASNFHDNLHHVVFVQRGGYSLPMASVNNASRIDYNNLLQLNAGRRTDFCAGMNYPQFMSAGIERNTQVYLSRMESMPFRNNYFYGAATWMGPIKGIAGGEATVDNTHNQFRGEYRSCYDLSRTTLSHIDKDDISADITEYGIHLVEIANTGGRARTIEQCEVHTTGGSGIAGISLTGDELDDNVYHNHVTGFTNGIEYFQPRDFNNPANISKIEQNKIDAVRSGVVVSYAEDPYNNTSGANLLVSSGYSYPIIVRIKCNRIKADYGILGTGQIIAQAYDVSLSPPEHDAGNYFATSLWDIIWGGDNGSPSFYTLDYYAPGSYAPNATSTPNLVMLDGMPYGIVSNMYTYYSSLPGGGVLYAAGCRPYSFDDPDGAKMRRAQEDGSPAVIGSEAIGIYPNPAHGELNIQAAHLQQGSVQVFDLTGRLVYSEELPLGGDALKVNTSSWNEGVYLVKVNENGKLVKAQKLIKTN